MMVLVVVGGGHRVDVGFAVVVAGAYLPAVTSAPTPVCG